MISSSLCYKDLRPGDVVLVAGLFAFMVISIEPADDKEDAIFGYIKLTELRLWWPADVDICPGLTTTMWHRDENCFGEFITRGDDR